MIAGEGAWGRGVGQGHGAGAWGRAGMWLGIVSIRAGGTWGSGALTHRWRRGSAAPGPVRKWVRERPKGRCKREGEAQEVGQGGRMGLESSVCSTCSNLKRSMEHVSEGLVCLDVSQY